jgi:hypothetical protein
VEPSGPQTDYLGVWCWNGLSSGPEPSWRHTNRDNSTGPLTYRTGVLINGTLGAPPTSITWTPDTDNPYATGCNPSVAVAWWGYDASNLNVTEAHAASCGAVSAQSSSFGYLVK